MYPQSEIHNQLKTQNQVASDVPTTAPQLSYRAAILKKVQPRIPQTAEGLPVGFYRVDLLPGQAPATSTEEIQALRNAYTDLSFEFGYPTQASGRPFWYKLDFEPGVAYAAFQIYLESIQTGPREISLVAANAELKRVLTSLSSPDAANTTENTADVDILPILNEFSVLYTWRARSRAYDLYKEAAYRHLKLRRQASLEDDHYVMATNLLTQLKEKVLNQPKFFDDMHPKTAVDLLTKLVGIQRVSVGLPSNGPLAAKDAPEDVSFEMIMRTLGQKSGAAGNVFENGTGELAGKNVLTEVLKDRESANLMQEMVIRITKSAQKPGEEEQRLKGRQFIGRNRTEHKINNEDLEDITPFDISDAPGVNLDSDSAATGGDK